MSVTTRFDDVYRAEVDDTPVQYLRALASQESGNNPDARSGSHVGLLQIGRVLLGDFNAANGTTLTLDDMRDPRLNVRVWAWSKRLYDRVFARDGGAAMPVPFTRDYAGILTAAHNSGIGAVSRALKVLVARGIAPTHAALFEAGRALPSATDRNLFRPAKERWQRGVVELFLSQRDPTSPAPAPRESDLPPRESPADAGAGGGLALLVVLLLLSHRR